MWDMPGGKPISCMDIDGYALASCSRPRDANTVVVGTSHGSVYLIDLRASSSPGGPKPLTLNPKPLTIETVYPFCTLELKPPNSKPASPHFLPWMNGRIKPLAFNPKSSTLNPKSSTLNPEASTLDPQPSTLNPKSSTLNPEASTLDPRCAAMLKNDSMVNAVLSPKP